MSSAPAVVRKQTNFRRVLMISTGKGRTTHFR
jgi:hypothetical protein